MIDINKNIERYLSRTAPTERFASFDYCFNYFQSFRENNRIGELASTGHIQMSCLQLGFYLASWGMFRASSHISKKSLKIYEHLIEGIAGFDKEIWSVDADRYDEKNIDLLFDCTWMIHNTITKYDREGKFIPSLTLITKVMLGVFGNIPAFDTFFIKSFKERQLDRKALYKIADFYRQNKALIDAFDIRTKDFYTGEPTHIRYTKAKIIDMIWFMEGQPENKRAI